MNKIKPQIKKLLKTTFWIVLSVSALFLAIAGIVQIPFVQNKIVNGATAFVSNKTHTSVTINNVGISFPKTVVIVGLFLNDRQKDTLLYAGKTRINISLISLLFNKIAVNSFQLEDMSLNLYNSETDSAFNYNFLLDAFSGDTKTPEKPGKTSWTFDIGNVSLKNIRLHYNDRYGGTDAQLALGKTEINLKNIDPGNSIYEIKNARIENLKARIQLNKTAEWKEDKKEPTGLLPKILADNIRVVNSTVSYTDQATKQLVQATIEYLDLKKGEVDLENEVASIGKLTLRKSKLQYVSNENDTAVTPDTAESPTPQGWDVTINHIAAEHNTVAYDSGNRKSGGNEFDPNHFKFSNVKLDIGKLHYSPNITELNVNNFNASGRQNFSIIRFRTAFRMDNHSVSLRNLSARTLFSSIDANAEIQYSSLKALKESLPYTVLNIDIKDSRFRNSEITYFNPALSKMEFFKNKDNTTSFSGKVQGKLNDLKGKSIVLRTGLETMLTTSFRITGLPDAGKSVYSFPDLRLTTCKKDLAMFVPARLTKNYGVPENLKLDLAFNGGMKNFKASARMSTSLGNANLTAELDASQRFDTKLELNELDLGSVLKDKNKYGPVSLTASAKGRGLDPTTLKANIKAQVSKIHLNKYTYHNLNIDGDIAGRRFAGKVKMEDKNADFEFDGLVDMNPGQEYYKFSFNVLVANLQKLNFTQRDMRIGFTATADLKGGRMEKLNGKAGITNLVIASEGKIYKLDSLFVASVNKGNQSEFSINSAIVGLKYNGSTSPVNLPASLTRFLNNYFPFGGSETAKTDTASSNFAFEIVLHNHPLISEILLPELKEFQPGSISGSFDSKKNELKISAEINKIQYGSLQVDDLNFDVNSNANELEYSISSSGISNSQVRFGNFIFNGKMGGNKILANVTSTDEKNTRKLLLHSQLTKPNGNYKFELLPDEFYLMNTRWDIANDNYIEFGKSGLRVHNLLLTNAGSEIKIASVHDRFNDDLNFSLKNFSLDDISHIIEKDTSLVGGQMDGKVMLKQLNKTYGIVANATVRNMEINGIPIGNLHLKAENPNPDKFDIDLSLKGTSNNLKINGQYNPNGGDNSLAFKILVDSLSMKTIEAFSFGQITESSGNVEGDFSVTGKTDSPQITGELVFNNVLLKPAVINNRLELKHETIRMNPNGIYFNAFTMLDPQHHPATIDGSVGMKQFSDFVFGLKVTTKDFMLFNTTASGNKDFYGKMLIDSKIDVSGPISLPVVNARLKMKEGSNFTYVVPEDRFTTNKGEGTVEFNDSSKLNPILLAGEDKAKPTTQLSGFDLSSIIEVDKKASLRLLMDPSSSDSLVVKGEAALSLTMDRSGKMSLTGAYNLVDGSYLVSLQSLIKRNFDINAGSTITWNGDPFDAGISIDATYNVKTAPIDLVADQIAGMSEADKAGYKMKYPFQVVLKLRGELMKPEISFEIQLPPGEKGILGGAVTQKLNMLNEDPSALNKQVFALLVLGRFVQENPLQTEAGGGTSVLLRSTVGNFLSSQLNMLSSKLVPGVDINFDIQSYDDYQAGQAGGRTQVEIGLKKQLFNQRFTVQLGGTLDVEGERAKQNSASDITGDVSVEYKVTEDGRYRLKGFRKNRYEGAIEGQVVETGAGIVYVRNFNVWKDIFKKPVKKPANE